MSNSSLPVSDVTVLIPTLNEVATIGAVVDGFHELGFDNILVIDGHSDDETRAVAADAGATVTTQHGAGKGDAVREAIMSVRTEFVLLVDGDGTYDPGEFTRLLAPLGSDEDGCRMVIGNRFANLEAGAMSGLHRVGNRMVNYAFFLLTGQYQYDILSGYRAFETELIREIGIAERGFGLETELCTKTALEAYETRVVPITYKPRPSGSESELRSFSDGVAIFQALARTRFGDRHTQSVDVERP
jgi:dolichol-phosphate mannosyltransferase